MPNSESKKNPVKQAEPIRQRKSKYIKMDSTERKLVNDRKNTPDAKFRNFLDNLGDVAYEADTSGNVTYANKEAEKITGILLKDIIGKPFLPLFTKESQQIAADVYERTLNGESAEYALTFKNGKICHFKNEPLKDENGKITGVFGIARDITKRKEMEKALRESQERFRDLFNNALLGLYRTSPDGRILMANPTLVRMLGYDSFEELAVRNLEEEGFEPQYSRSNFKERIETDGRVIGLEADWKRRDGTILSVRESAGAIRDEHGNIRCYEGTVEDITERKHAEQELRRHRDHLEEMVATRTRELEKNNEALQTEIAERKQTEEALRMSELRFRSLIEQTMDAVFCYEYDPPIQTDLPVEQQVRLLYGGVLVECNDVCAKSYGADRAEDVIGKRLTELFRTSPGGLDELFTEMIEHGYRTVDGEGIERLEDGTERYYLNNGHGVIENGKLIRIWGTFRDITDRKKAQEILRQYEFMVESAHDAIFFKDRQSRYIIANKKTLESFGLPCEKVIGKSDYEIMPDKEQAKNNIDDDRAVFEAGKTKEIIKEMTGADGKQYWFQTVKVPHFDENGDVIGLIGIARDITERKQAEEALRESEEKFRSLAEQSPSMIFINKKGKIVYVNKKCEEVMGYTREEFCSPDFDFHSLITEESLGLINEKFAQHLRGQEVQPYDYSIIRKDGKRIEAINSSKLIQYEGQSAILGIVTDITERKKSEQALRESEERLKILFESAPDAIYLIDSEGRFVDGNRAALELIGFAKDEVIGKSLTEMDLLSDGQLSKAKANLKKAAAGKLSGPNEYTLKRKNGSHVSVEVRTFPVKIGGKVLTQGIARDITGYKRTEKKLLEHQAKLKSLASRLSLAEESERYRLATDLHDQISQSLVISKIKLDQLRKSSDSDEFKESLKDISNCLGQVIDDTRALTFDLSYPILYELGFEAAVAEWLADQIQEKYGIKTEFIDDGHKKPLDDDIRVLLFRNVRELLINVVKHAQSKRVKVSVRKVKDNIRVRVEDDGIGFDPAEVMSMSAKRAEFGLFSVRERLEQLGGLIEIDSGAGRGTKITMAAPLKKEKAIDRV